MTSEEFIHIQEYLEMSNAQIARKLCVTESAITRWRSGARNISPRMENAIRMLLDITEVPSKR